MAQIRVFNPYNRREGYAAHGESESSRGGTSYARRGVITMARHHHRRHHHRRHNPMSYRRHRHRNPFFESGEIGTIAWGAVGAVGARAIPAMVLPSKNNGLMGYGLNLASAFALKFVGN